MTTCVKIFLATALAIPLLLCSRAEAVLVDLKPEDIRKAIEYGKAGIKTDDMAEFSKEWTVTLGKKVGWATIYTGFHNLAYKARKAAAEHRELTPEEIKKAVAKRDVITFSVTVMTDSLYYNYFRRSTLHIGDRTVAASFEHLPDMCDDSDYFPKSPYYTAACVYQFPFKDIDPNSKIILAVVRPEGDELHFNFDLSRIR